MQNFQRNWELQCSAGSRAKGVISGVGKGLVGVFTKPIGGAAELVSQTGYGEFWVALNLHGHQSLARRLPITENAGQLKFN